VTIFPLAIVTGGIAGYTNWLVKIPLWMLLGIVASWCALYIPYDGARVLLQNFDANLQLVEFLPASAAAAASFGMLAMLGASVGALIGLAQSVTVSWAWERSTEDFQMTLVGSAMFLFVLPLALALGVLFDGTAHQPLRAPQELIHAVIESGLNDAPDQDERQMETPRARVYSMGQRWRKNFAPEYVIRLASSEPSAVGESFVDATFSNGFTLRCRVTTYGEFAGACYDLNVEYARYLSEFVPRGSFRCAECQARVTQQAADWRAANARPLASGDRVSAHHGAGSSVVMRVDSQTENSFECLVWGANPVIVQQCRNL
jgi:hypothetical protein